MAYGLQILNKFGEDVVQLDKKHLYAFQSGTTKLMDDLETEGINAMAADGYPTDSFGDKAFIFSQYHTTEQYTYRTHAASPAGTYTIVATSPTKGLIHPEFNLIDGDLVFYDVSTSGLLMSYNLMSYGFPDATPLGGVNFMEAEGGASLDYVVASTRKPVASPGTNYGLQIYDGAGAEVFDSRQDLFTIFDHFYVSRDVMRRVIEGGVTITFDLSESHADFKVASTSHVSFYTFEGGYRAQCAIKKVDDNTISLSRVDNGGDMTGTYRKLWQETTIIVGR